MLKANAVKFKRIHYWTSSVYSLMTRQGLLNQLGIMPAGRMHG